jgi:hypothetical protein
MGLVPDVPASRLKDSVPGMAPYLLIPRKFTVRQPTLYEPDLESSVDSRARHFGRAGNAGAPVMVTVGIVAAVVIAVFIVVFIAGTKRGVEELDAAPKPPEHDASRDDVPSPR